MINRSLQIQAIQKNDGTVRFVASTGSTDRYGDIIDQDGWQLDAYRRNPVVLLNHQTNQLPIGKGLVEVVDGNLMIDVEFDETDELAQKVSHKARNGFMHAVSVGFNPVEAISRSELPEEHRAYSKHGGNLFTKAELLEVSIVTIPANSEATTMSQKKLGIRAMIREIIAQEIRAAFEEVSAPDGYHWMDYQDGPVLMEGEDSEHDGASSSFRFEVIEEHDETKLKAKEEEEEERAYGKEEEEEKANKEEEEEEKEHKPDHEEDEEMEKYKSFDALIALLS